MKYFVRIDGITIAEFARLSDAMGFAKLICHRAEMDCEITDPNINLIMRFNLNDD